jgi:hypothetical protein
MPQGPSRRQHCRTEPLPNNGGAGSVSVAQASLGGNGRDGPLIALSAFEDNWIIAPQINLVAPMTCV